DERGQTSRAGLLLLCADNVMHCETAIPRRLLIEKLPGFLVGAELFFLLRIEGRGRAFVRVNPRLFFVAGLECARAGIVHQSSLLQLRRPANIDAAPDASLASRSETDRVDRVVHAPSHAIDPAETERLIDRLRPGDRGPARPPS